jgi:hypothetical protein
MKASIKFSALYFGLQLFFVIVIYVLFPKVYPGDSFTIIWFYIINLIFGIIMFPIFSFLIRKLCFKRKLYYVLAYFFCALLIINTLPLLTEHIIYTFKIICTIFGSAQIQINTIIEFINPIVSFALSFFLFRGSDLWVCSAEIES